MDGRRMGKMCRRGYKQCMPIAVLVCLPLAVMVVTQQRWLEALGALAALGLVVHRRHGDRRAREEAGSGTGGIDEVVLAVNRGGHVEEVLSSLARQACSIMRVERAM